MTTPLPTLFLSFDVETDGTNPLTNNLLSIGIYGLTNTGKNIFTFSENILQYQCHCSDRKTMDFWNKPENAIAWRNLLQNRKDYKLVFQDLSDKLCELAKTYKLVFIASPSAFDWMFLKCYYESAQDELGEQFYDIGYKCECISTAWKTFVLVKKLNSTDANELKNKIETHCVETDDIIEHVAIDDARKQGVFYVNLLRYIEMDGFD